MVDDTISKIGRGVDQLEADKTNSVPTSNLSRFSSGPKTLSERGRNSSPLFSGREARKGTETKGGFNRHPG